jgi:ribosomal protein S18 acetylase RimI-like enzyme
MSVRRAGPADFEAVTSLGRELDHELPPPVHANAMDTEQQHAEVREILETELAFVAEDDEQSVTGYALVRRRSTELATVVDIYVIPAARGSGVAPRLMRAVVAALKADGVTRIDLAVAASNALARSFYGRWGLREEVIVMAASIADLEERLGKVEAGSFGSIHIQSDDLSAVEEAVRQFVPRLPGGSRGSIVAPPRNGWIAVYDDVCDRDPEMLRRLARELSHRMASVILLLGVEQDDVVRMILFERGRVVDEYLSVPEYHGPLPPGDVIGLQANPTVVHRLTGAEPDAVRRTARTAASPADLPPAREILAALAEALRVEGTSHGWGDAPQSGDVVRIDRA